MSEESEPDGYVNSSLGNSLPAIRAVPEFGGDRLAALGAGLGGPEFEGAYPGMAGLIEDPSTAATFKKCLPPFDRNQRNEEKADIVVKALQPG